MPVNNYVVAGVLFGFPAAIFFHFWPDHVYAGIGFMVIGFLMAGYSCLTKEFGRTIKQSSLGFLLVIIGGSILPIGDWAWALLVAAVVVSQLTMADVLDKRIYDLREHIGAAIGVTLPVLALLISKEVGDLPLNLFLAFVVCLFGSFGLVGHWIAPDATSGIDRYYAPPKEQSA